MAVQQPHESGNFLVNKKAKAKDQPLADDRVAASISPTSPIKKNTVPLNSKVGKVAKGTHAAAMSAVSKQKEACHLPIKHLCNHFTKCNEGRCQTCKCAKCKVCQVSGKRASALRV